MIVVDAIAVARARRLGGRDEIVRDAGERGDDDDRIRSRRSATMSIAFATRSRIADRGAAEFDDDHGRPPASG